MTCVSASSVVTSAQTRTKYRGVCAATKPGCDTRVIFPRCLIHLARCNLTRARAESGSRARGSRCAQGFVARGENAVRAQCMEIGSRCACGVGLQGRGIALRAGIWDAEKKRRARAVYRSGIVLRARIRDAQNAVRAQCVEMGSCCARGLVTRRTPSTRSVWRWDYVARADS